MNIAQLLHNYCQQQTITHWPVYSFNEQKKSWYFYSAKGISLRKKPQNTSLVEFLGSRLDKQGEKSQARSSQNITIIQVKQIDYRQPKSAQFNMILVKRIQLNSILNNASQISYENLIKENEWKPRLYEQINLYKIQNIQQNKIYNLFWSENIISCKAPISTHMKDKLVKYSQLICKKAEQKFLSGLLKVRQFQLVFTYDSINGKIKILFANNFKLRLNSDVQNKYFLYQDSQKQKITNQRQMYYTDLKVGQDQYEQIQLIIEDKINATSKTKNLQQTDSNKCVNQEGQFQDRYDKLKNYCFDGLILDQMENKFEQKRLMYIKTLQKLQNQQNEFSQKLKIALKKQAQSIQCKQFQCTACNSYVKVGKFQTQKFVSSNRIPQIQIRRQVKMKAFNLGSYDSVPVCELCYTKFKQIVELRQKQKITHEKKSKRQSRITDIISEIDQNSYQLKNQKHTKEDGIQLDQQLVQYKKIPVSIKNLLQQMETEQINTPQNIKEEISLKQQQKKYYLFQNKQNNGKKRIQYVNEKTNASTVPQSLKSILPHQQGGHQTKNQKSKRIVRSISRKKSIDKQIKRFNAKENPKRLKSSSILQQNNFITQKNLNSSNNNKKMYSFQNDEFNQIRDALFQYQDNNKLVGNEKKNINQGFYRKRSESYKHKPKKFIAL